MKLGNEIHTYYEVLNLDLSSDWDTCKRVYKRSVNTWHPDKFAGNEKSQKLAEEKLKTINIAYSTIADYYQLHGKMPGLDLHEKDTPNDKLINRQQFNVSSLYKNIHSTSLYTQNNKYKYVSILLLILVIIAFILLSLEPIDNTETSAVQLAQEKIDLHDLDKKIEPKTKKYFTIGSSIDEVLDSQGTPTHTIAEKWFFGQSWVVFKKGVVSDWFIDKKYPLNVNIASYESELREQTSDGKFGIGSTKKEVMGIQGLPLQRTTNVWYYKVSKVYFKNGKVSSWYNSALDPLKIKQSLKH